VGWTTPVTFLMAINKFSGFYGGVSQREIKIGAHCALRR
jgi:hypothetical protein